MPMSGPRLDSVIDRATATPLSYRATRGFLSRIEESGVPVSARFMADLEAHLAAMRDSIAESDVRQSWSKSPASKSLAADLRSSVGTPELRLRRQLSALGVRYRLQARPIPDLRWRSDIVFSQSRVAVEVRSCFWHGCEIHHDWPAANVERWAAKRLKLQLRNSTAERELETRGWRLIVVWEHEDSAIAAQRIKDALGRKQKLPLHDMGRPAEVSVA
jgi:DNA mismatch endonuclease Vsr